MTECIALEEAAHGLRAHAVAPGVIDTDMQATIRATPPDRFPDQPRFVERKRVGRFSSAAFVADQLLTVAFDPTTRTGDVCISLPDE